MVQLYRYSTIQVKNILAILYIHRSRDISLLFCNNQDTESEEQEMEIGVAGPIITQKNIKGSMEQRYPYPTRRKKNIVAIVHIHGARTIYFYCMINNTLIMSNEK